MSGGAVIPADQEAISLVRSLPHGAVPAALGAARKMGRTRRQPLPGPHPWRDAGGLDHVVLVGDRGMIAEARITEDIKPAGLDWITALRALAIRSLVDGGAFQMSLFDDRDMATIASPDSRASA